MKPIDYIYKNLGHLNMTILKQLIIDADETVSEEIYDYLKETPWNTNVAILKEMGLDITPSKTPSLFFKGRVEVVPPETEEGDTNISTAVISQSLLEANKILLVINGEKGILSAQKMSETATMYGSIITGIFSKGTVPGMPDYEGPITAIFELEPMTVDLEIYILD